MYVIKRSGVKETVYFDKITSRIKKLSYELLPNVEPVLIAQKVCTEIYCGVSTSELDELAAQISASLITKHPDYGKLAARICVSNLHKNTLKSFSSTIQILRGTGENSRDYNYSIIAADVYDVVMKNASELDSAII